LDGTLRTEREAPHQRSTASTEGHAVSPPVVLPAAGCTASVTPGSIDMGWEKRDRGGLYYTRSRKVGGRVVREYVGGGTLGHLAALRDAQERKRREEEAALWKEERERLEALVAPVEQLCEATEILYRATLVAAGFRRHQRGEWRRQREPKE
jgi:nucleotide-binding universal stress UspA family protein